MAYKNSKNKTPCLALRYVNAHCNSDSATKSIHISEENTINIKGMERQGKERKQSKSMVFYATLQTFHRIPSTVPLFLCTNIFPMLMLLVNNNNFHFRMSCELFEFRFISKESKSETKRSLEEQKQRT